jgi:glyoxylase-like metal-dependent hydrolase (beta-lactamase superfamily II)
LFQLVVAPNPGPMTLDGTNTWLVGDPSRGPVVVVDPGPLMESHLQSILGAAAYGIAAVVLTHRHADHSEAAGELARRAGCGVRAADPAWQFGPEGLRHGDVLTVEGSTLEVIATPGHTSDSVCLVLRDDDEPTRVLTGDTVLGRGTTVITYPDGDLGDYLQSLDRLESLGAAEILPGHGPVVADPGARLAAYRKHRLDRLEQVRRARAAGARTAADVIALVYAEVDRAVWPAAEQSVRAQLEYLDRHG